MKIHSKQTDGDISLRFHHVYHRKNQYSQTTSRRLCMTDPEFNHGFTFDDQGRTDILHSPFFDVQFIEDDVTVEEYIDRILYQLTLAIEEHIPAGHWKIMSRPTNPPSPTPSTRNSALKATCLLVASLSLISIFLRK
ncbi:hypothetical protein M5K25_013838 [Dendrobium thyrsiflorum]|uniref:Uncharacterized protein n=1 Tax=Dendrobium thyrsiflorum TaxID=117978 RepID=A0ABD0UUP9_DENTH